MHCSETSEILVFIVGTAIINYLMVERINNEHFVTIYNLKWECYKLLSEQLYHSSLDTTRPEN